MYLFEAGLAAWRVAHMLVEEAGPDDVFSRLRQKTGIEYDTNGRAIAWPPLNPLHCVYCTSLYTALLALLLPQWLRRGLAVAAVAALVQAAITEPAE